MPIGTYAMAHATLVGHRDVQSTMGAILGLISILHWSIVLVVTLEDQQNALQKSRLVNI